ncbi:MAG: thymidine phosphorylase [Ignavibacterium sp.]|nr:MAG: thymidine phosphorylase [Ignavibacterium sp.]
MNIVELIIKKRNGLPLTKEEIFFFTNSFTNGKISDYQFSALLMAICIKGMNKKETSYLTEAMLYSGIVVNLDRIKGPKIDKHSTGGVGDKTSLIIAPIVASAGVNVPMISGRGLGHTGGTLDKLDSIPGFRTNLNLKEYKEILRKCGTVLIGQTKEIAPADKLFYQLRDVTGTVESFPLITGSIMSKKLAEGIDGLVLDVKTGSGAFMRKTSDALSLANLLISTAKSFDKQVIAFITDMNQPLGNNVGNWLEVEESINVLKGKADGDLLKLSLSLAGAMIYMGGKSKSISSGIKIAQEKISNGDAFNKFVEVVSLQGGNPKFILNPEKYRKPRFVKRVRASRGGFIKAIDNYTIGMASLELGAGRKSLKDKIDPKAGIIFKRKIGDKVKKSETIAELHSDSKTKIDIASEMILNSISYSNKKVAVPRLIKKVIT